jgi:hypothetical protein
MSVIVTDQTPQTVTITDSENKTVTVSEENVVTIVEKDTQNVTTTETNNIVRVADDTAQSVHAWVLKTGVSIPMSHSLLFYGLTMPGGGGYTYDFKYRTLQAKYS